MKIKIRNTVLYAAMFSCISTLTWMLFSVWGRDAVIFLLIMTVIMFLMYLTTAKLTQKAPKAAKIIIKTIEIILTVIMLTYVLFTILAAYAMFYPHKSESADKILAAGEIDGCYTEKIQFESGIGKISGWMIKDKDYNAPMVLYFGGNAEVSGDKILTLITSGYYKRMVTIQSPL